MSVQLANAQNMFSHHAIDYGYQINTISCVKGHEILSNVSTPKQPSYQICDIWNNFNGYVDNWFGGETEASFLAQETSVDLSC